MANQDKTTGARSILNQFLTAFQDNPTTMKNFFFSAIMVGLEILLNEELFNCPREGYELYGRVFIVAPIPIIFFANVLIIGKMWNVCEPEAGTQPPQEQLFKVCQGILSNSFKAMVGPGMWLVATFADADYYVCATVGPGAVKRNLTDADEIKALEEKIDAARSSSHLVAWLMFFVLALSGTVFIGKKNCFPRDNGVRDDNAMSHPVASSSAGAPTV